MVGVAVFARVVAFDEGCGVAEGQGREGGREGGRGGSVGCRDASCCWCCCCQG